MCSWPWAAYLPKDTADGNSVVDGSLGDSDIGPVEQKRLRNGEASRKAFDLFVRCLEAEGVTHIFGIPGEANADLMISLMDGSIRFVLCRHESQRCSL